MDQSKDMKNPGFVRRMPAASAFLCALLIAGCGARGGTLPPVATPNAFGAAASLRPHEMTKFGTGFQCPTGVAVDAYDNVFVLDNCLHGVYKIAPSGATSRFAPGVEAGGSGIAVDAGGNVYVYANNYKGWDGLVEISPSGTATRVGPNTIYENPVSSLAVDTSENILVVQKSVDDVTKITPDNKTSTIGSGLIKPYGDATDNSGNVYVDASTLANNDGLFEITPNGKTSLIASGLDHPAGVAVPADCSASCTTYVAQGHSVLQVGSNGTSSVLATGFDTANGLAVDVAGNVFVADTNAKTVWKVASAYQVLYSFGHGAGDGGNPNAGLVEFGGILYGTTYGGGTHDYGTAFRMTTAGLERILHSFGSTNDGVNPYASLAEVNGTFYGTTASGGTHGAGTIFSVSSTGKERVLYSFKNLPDGANPTSSLVDVGGVLYGTTIEGGANAGGTVFRVTTVGKERVLHSFLNTSTDGAFPSAGLTAIGSTLYGVTDSGGTNQTCSNGCGTIFSVSTAGRERVLHNFTSADGSHPGASLIAIRGLLYGTTEYGGGSASCRVPYAGCGTAFSVSTTGSLHVLHRFAGGTDGGIPSAPLLAVGSVSPTIYGTTFAGGTYCSNTGGCGTIFSLSGGTERVLHSFGANTLDANGPLGALIDVNGTLYGTTDGGGTNELGTVFSFVP